MAATILDSKTLNPTDAHRGSRSRKAALWLLRVLAIPAFAATPAAVYLWVRTLETCWDTYFLRRQASSLVLNPGSAESLLEFFIKLDLSSCSALICLLLVAFLAKSGLRNSWIVPYREADRFWRSAYAYHLFPSNFWSLSIQLGLIGTLLSFVFAALTMIADLSDMSAESTVKQETLTETDSTRATSQQGESPTPPKLSGSQAAYPSDQEQDTAKRAKQSSQRIFLLLCASLISTLVGCVVAYLILPPLEWVNGIAMGRHQLQPVGDTETTMQQLGATVGALCTTIDHTTKRLGEFNQIIDLTGQLATKVQNANQAMPELASQFRALNSAVATSNKTILAATDGLKHTTTEVQAVTNRLDSLAAKLDKNYTTLSQLPAAFRDPLHSLKTASDSLASLAKSASQSQSDLATFAKRLEEPVSLVAQVIHNALSIISQVHESIRSLAHSQHGQREDVKRVADSFTSLEVALQSIVGEVRTLVETNRDGHTQVTQKLDDIGPTKTLASEIAIGVARVGTTLHELKQVSATLTNTVNTACSELGAATAGIRDEQKAQRRSFEILASRLNGLHQKVKRLAGELRRKVRAKPGSNVSSSSRISSFLRWISWGHSDNNRKPSVPHNDAAAENQR